MRRHLPCRGFRLLRAALLAALPAVLPAVLLLLPGAGPARADVPATLAALAAEAAKGPPVVWYESSRDDQADQVLAAFSRRYPAVQVQHVRIVGGNMMAGRVVQEVQAQGHSADLATAGADAAWAMNDRGLLLHTDWQALGIPKAVTPTDFAVAIAASVYVILYNTDRVPADRAPTGWDDIFAPRWKGRIGVWVRAEMFAQMAFVWGAERAEAELRKLIALQPYLFKSTFPLAQQVGAGEVDVAIGFFHTAQPPLRSGAPIRLVALDPTPMHTIYTGITRTARNPAGAKLLLAWLTSPDGARAYEDATSRGNHLLPGTRTRALVQGRTTAEFPPERTAEYQALARRFNELMQTAGTAR